jgi:hypothetical protein
MMKTTHKTAKDHGKNAKQDREKHESRNRGNRPFDHKYDHRHKRHFDVGDNNFLTVFHEMSPVDVISRGGFF